MEIKIVTDINQISSLLSIFDCVFSSLDEIIQDYALFAQKLAQNAVVCVAKENKTICGLAAFYANDFENKTAFITLFGILPAFQRKHIGKQLMDFCFSAAINRGMEYIRLEVDLNNPNAIAFYENNGFTRTGDYTPTSMYMKKALV